jgi:hypothetical protein
VVVPNIETAIGRIHSNQGVMVTDSWNREQHNAHIGSFPLEFSQKVICSWIAKDSNKFLHIFMDRLTEFFSAQKAAKPKTPSLGTILNNTLVMQYFK